MKKLVTITILLVSMLTLVAAPAQGKRDISKKKALMAGKIAEQGGMVEEKYDGNVIRIVSVQESVAEDALKSIAKDVRRVLGVPVEVNSGVTGKDVFDQAKGALLRERTGAVVLVIDSVSAPALLIAPEAAWAAVNVKPLIADGNVEKLPRRTRQEIWRALAFALNGTDSQMQPCLMTIVKSVRNLDNNSLELLSPEPLMKMADGCTARGMRHARRATYRRACAEGWAPEPVTDVQKAIWAEFHAKPTEPMKIKYDPKKGE